MSYSYISEAEQNSVLLTLDADLAAAGRAISTIGAALKTADATIVERFSAGADIGDLVRLRASAIDHVLLHLWQDNPHSGNDIALVAVGGYGRGELHPRSDVDIMLMLPSDFDTLRASTFQCPCTFRCWYRGSPIARSMIGQKTA